MQALFDGIRPKLISSNPTSELLHDSQQLQVWAACAINLCELFRIRRHNMQNHPRLQTALFTFWTPFRRWVERLFTLVLDMDIDESELCVTVAGLHDVWDVVGFFRSVHVRLDVNSADRHTIAAFLCRRSSSFLRRFRS